MFKVMVEGDYACFTRPDLKAERVSYPVPTPSALEGMLKSVYWKPAMRYVIEKIVVFNPVEYVSVGRNETKCKVSVSKVISRMGGAGADPSIYVSEARFQRSALMLRDVRYGVEFRIETTGIRSDGPGEGLGKHAGILRRRLERGQCFRTPCLGCRELPVRSLTLCDGFDLSEVDGSLMGEEDLGVMLYGLRFRDDAEALRTDWNMRHCSDAADAVFYRPRMVDGVIDVEGCLEA